MAFRHKCSIGDKKTDKQKRKENMEKVKQRLAKAIRESNLSLEEIAEKTGIPLQKVKRYRDGAIKPSVVHCANFCKVLHLPFRELIKELL